MYMKDGVTALRRTHKRLCFGDKRRVFPARQNRSLALFGATLTTLLLGCIWSVPHILYINCLIFHAEEKI